MKGILKQAIENARANVTNTPTKSISKASKIALNAAAAFVRTQKIPKNELLKSATRVIPVPKIGGALPLIPLFAGLSALGSLIGGVSGIAKAVKLTNDANENLGELKRHNRTMEAIAVGKTKTGSGLYLKSYRSGLGVYIKPYHGGGCQNKQKIKKSSKKKECNPKN